MFAFLRFLALLCLCLTRPLRGLREVERMEQDEKP